MIRNKYCPLSLPTGKEEGMEEIKLFNMHKLINMLEGKKRGWSYLSLTDKTQLLNKILLYMWNRQTTIPTAKLQKLINKIYRWVKWIKNISSDDISS